MSSVNKVIIVGRLGQDPEVRYSSSGDNAITTISIATSESWKDKNTGQKQEKTEWHRVVFFGALAKIAGDYLKKGSQAYIEGKLQTRKWTDQSGQDKYTTEVVVDGFNGVMQMLGDSSGQGANKLQQKQAPKQSQQNKAPDDGGFDDSFDDNSIPF